MEKLFFGDGHLHCQKGLVEQFDFWSAVDVAMEDEVNGPILVVIVVSSTDIYLLVEVDIFIFSVGVDYLTINYDLGSERDRVLVHEAKPIPSVSSVLLANLDFMQYMARVFALVSDIVELVELYKGVETLHSHVQGFRAVPLPLSPTVDLVFPATVCGTHPDRDYHDLLSGLRDVLPLYHTYVVSPTYVVVPSWVGGTTGNLIGNPLIVRYESGRLPGTPESPTYVAQVNVLRSRA